MKKYTVIINTYPHEHRKEDLTRCLVSISKQTYKNFTVMIVENSSTPDNVISIVQSAKIQDYKIVCDTTKKLSYLFNLGFKNAQTDYLAFVADDVEITSKWLEVIEEELENNSDIGVATGPIISTCYPAGEMHRLYLISQTNWFTKVLTWPYIHFVLNDKPLVPGNLFNSGAYSLGAGLKESVEFPRQEIDLATTSSMAIRRDCLIRIDGFDEAFWFNHADGDLFIRVKKAGWKIIFNPNIIAYHHVRMGPSRNAYFIGRDTGLFYKKHIRIKSISSLIGILMNIMVLNFYWIYSTFRNKDYHQLKGIYGFIQGFLG